MGEVISDDEEKESDSEQLTELESTDNSETQSQEKLDLQAKFSRLAQFGYNGAKIPVFPPNPTPQVAISLKSDVSQVENNYQQQSQELQSDEAEKENKEISSEGEKIQFSGGVSGDEDNHKVIQTQLVAGESSNKAQDERWKNINIPVAIAYNQGLYTKETTSVIQDTIKVKTTGEFNEETVLAIAKWQQDKGLKEIDGKIGYGTRKSLGITQRLFDDKEGYEYDYFEGQPFVRGAEDRDEIDPNDVAQGNLGNCYFAAGMMAVALANPSLIRELIKDNGDGSYNVTLYNEEGKKVEIKVTPYFPTVATGVPAYARRGDEQELWPMLLEKAYAQYKEGYGETGKGEGGYDLIGKGGTPGDALKLLTGSLPQEFKEKYPNIQIKDVYLVQEEDWLNVAEGIASSLREHCAVTAGTIEAPDGEEKATKKGNKKVGENGIYFNNSYVIKSIYKKVEGEPTPDNILLDLLNPWGEEHINGLSMRLFQEYFDTLYINPVSQKYVAPKAPVSQPELAESSPVEKDSWLPEPLKWVWGVLQGDFNEDPSISQIVVRTLITLIPGIDIAGDIQDLVAALHKLAWQKRYNEAEPWFDLFLSGIGFVPALGSALKGIVKVIKRGANDIDVTALKPILGPFADNLGELVRNFPGYAEDAEKYAKLIVGDLASKAEQTAKTLRGYIPLDLTGKLRQFVDKLDEVTRTLEEILSLIGDKFRGVADEILDKLERIKARGEGDEAGVPRRGRISVEGELTRLSAGGGHTLIVTRSGKIFRCSSCEEISQWYGEVLAKNPSLAQRLEELQTKYRQIAEMEPGAQRNNLQQQADRELTQLENELQDADSLWDEFDQSNSVEILPQAQNIANGHAFTDHRFEFERIGITTREQLAEHISNIINNPSDVKSLKRGRTAYWDDETGTVVIYDPADQAENGTAFIPENGKYYFTDEIE